MLHLDVYQEFYCVSRQKLCSLISSSCNYLNLQGIREYTQLRIREYTQFFTLRQTLMPALD